MTTQILTYRITLDTFKNGVQRILQGFQTGEDIARKIEITLVSGADTFELPLDNVSASMYVLRPSQSTPSINACEIDHENNRIIYEVDDDDITESGIVSLQLKVIDTTYGDARTIISPKFGMEVYESTVDDSSAITTPTYTSLTSALAAAQEVSRSAITEFYIDDDNIITVEFADGTVYTSDVIADALEQISDIDDYVAGASASAASALASATSASSSATSASSSAQNASASETAAATSEANALISETNASASATSASTSETNALAYKTAALSAKTDAETAATSALASATSASTSATNAYAYEQSASASASSASASAQNIATHEANALSYSTLSKSYAVGGTSSRAGENNDNAKYYKEQCQQIAGGLQGGFIPMGTVTFATLATLTPNAGYMYNISDEFTTDNTFKDGSGKKYAAGTNVYYTADNLWDCLSGAVPTVNNKNGNSITLDGSDILVTGYSQALTETSISATDSINVALGKLEKKADGVSGKISTAINNLGEILKYKGTVANYASLPSNASPGDVYHVTSEGTNYAYEVEPGQTTGSWSEMGQHINLSGYVEKTSIKNTLGTNATDAPASAKIVDDVNTTATSALSKANTNETAITAINSNLVANDYVITTDMWVSDSTNEDYPYKATITSSKYKANGVYSALVLPNGDTPFLSEDELDFKNNMIGDNGWSYNGSVCFWAKDVPTVSIKLRIIGED